MDHLSKSIQVKAGCSMIILSENLVLQQEENTNQYKNTKITTNAVKKEDQQTVTVRLFKLIPMRTNGAWYHFGREDTNETMDSFVGDSGQLLSIT